MIWRGGPKVAQLDRGRARVLGKYLLFQVPGWVVVALVLTAAVRWWGFSKPLAYGLFGLWMLKDFVLFPLFRRAYEPAAESAAENLIGVRGTATQPVDSGGFVRVGAELWKAKAAKGVARIPRGAAVRVRAVRGLTLIVEPDGGDARGDQVAPERSGSGS
jgi:membrane-bound ClpP family serine protease